MKGKVYLVGAGPGDPGLVTVKGLRLLEGADVVVYDRLVDRQLLSRARADAELVDVGKGRGEKRLGQEEINLLLIKKAQEHKKVVRLKGGDPFIFGRGGEEAEALAEARVPFEIVPGVTSAVAVPAYAGIPLTHRHISSSFTVVSGSEDPTKEGSRVQWDRLATGAGTLVVLMAWESLPQIVEALKSHGMPSSTPVALIRWGTEPYQVTVTGVLTDIVERGREASLEPPVVAVIGDVVGFRERLRWFDKKPLFGKRVLVTRTRQQASMLSKLLAEEGAEPLELPTIKIEPVEDASALDEAIAGRANYQWVVFTSANAVGLFFNRMQAQGLDARAFAGVKVCAIGPATAEALAGYGIRAELVPEAYVAEAVVETMAPFVNGANVLLPRSVKGREALSHGLVRAGARVHSVPLYRPIVPDESRVQARELVARADVVTFTSSSTVGNLLRLLKDDASLLEGKTIACIGPITAETAQQAGLSVQVVARKYDIEGLVDALKGFFAGKEV